MFSNMSIKARLGLGFGVILLLMVLIAWLGYSQLQNVQGRLEEITSGTMVKIKLSNTMNDAVSASANANRNIALLIEENPIEVDLQRIVTEKKIYDDAVAALTKLKTSEAGSDLLKRIADVRQKTGPIIDQVQVLAKTQRNMEGTALWKAELHPAEIKWQAMLAEMVKLQEADAHTETAAARSAYESTTALLMVLTIASIVFGCALGYWITGAISRPILSAVEISHAVASGDLSMEIVVDGSNETAQLLIALRDMRDHLVHIVADVRESAELVAVASNEISQGNQEMSSRTESQASALEETSASMEELSTSLNQNAEHARHADDLARNASEVAMKGGSAVNEVVTTMKEINESSKQIADIVSVIDAIAFQTNILALNAAVEAARAGEQGRGFAVVASEVRSLAQRSAEAAKQIKSLIAVSVERVEKGSMLVDNAGARMIEIVESIRQVTTIIAEITSSSLEQNAGIGQVCQAVSDMDHTTQQNAAMVEESAAAAESLKDLAQQLVDSMAVFKIDSGRNGSVKPYNKSAGAQMGELGARRHQNRTLAIGD